FGTMAARGVVRDVGRAMNFSFAETDRIAKLIPDELKMTIDKALEQEPRLRELVEEDPRVEKLISIARKLEGLSRHASTHAAGVVIAKEDLVNYVPLQGNDEEGLTTQLPMTTLEELGLLKMDFLGLRTLTILKKTIDMIRTNRGIEIDLSRIPLDDKPTFDLLCAADTMTVFQLESDGMRNVLSELQPSVFEDIIALVALYRPGPMDQIPIFIASKHGKVPVTYPHPALEAILKETYGVMIYQEQIMLAASTLAGFSLGQADILRRAMGKKKKEEMLEQRKAFVAGCMNNGIAKKKAEEIYELIFKFADYGFNKSHSAAYGLVAYQTAYFKANYTIEFLAANLGSVMANTDKVALYIDHCRRQGIEVLPPDINESGVDFTVVGDKIRFGLGAVKNLGVAAVEELLDEREKNGPFVSLADFCNRMNGRCNKRMLENMIKGGCMDSLPGHRAQKLAAMDNLLANAARLHKQKLSGQMDIFDILGEPEPEDQLPPIAPFSRKEMLQGEKDALGVYLSGHPLEDYVELLDSLNVASIPSLEEMEEGSEVTVAGIAAACRTLLTRKGKHMAFLTLEDQFTTLEVIIFDEVLSQCRDLLAADYPILVTGRLEFAAQGEPKLRAERICKLEAPNSAQKLYLKIEADTDQDCINRVLYAL
ncbi:MAG: DNA polymerase III subunit alpha, partial [Firmicutes bacterium]|nr:DNA polymerase III subunit alpha [Bacillota bacterium]